jgi:hypothetical protein
MAVIVAANFTCTGYFARPDALFMLSTGLTSAITLLAWRATHVPASAIVDIPFGVLAGLAITPSLPIVLAVLFTGLGLATALEGPGRPLRITVLVLAIAVTTALLYALVGLVSPAQARCE